MGSGRALGLRQIWCIVVLKSDIWWHQTYRLHPSPQSGSAESKISGKLKKTAVAKEKERSGFISRLQKFYDVNIKNFVCQIIGSAATGSAGGTRPTTHIHRVKMSE